MKKLVAAIVAITSIVLASCNVKPKSITSSEQSKRKDSAAATDVPFTEAKGYFVKNTFTADQLKRPKITTQKEFDDLFGVAAVMGEIEKPTVIDFSEQYVIAIIGEKTDSANTIAVKSLKQTSNAIHLLYEVKAGDKQSFISQPVLILLVDDQYKGEITTEKKP